MFAHACCNRKAVFITQLQVESDEVDPVIPQAAIDFGLRFRFQNIVPIGLHAAAKKPTDAGVVVETGDPAEVLANPQHQRTRAFFSKVL